MKIQDDNSGQKFIEIPAHWGGSVRVTLIEEREWADGENCIRVQIREKNGHLKQGPEIPESIFYSTIEATKQLLKNAD